MCVCMNDEKKKYKKRIKSSNTNFVHGIVDIPQFYYYKEAASIASLSSLAFDYCYYYY